MKQIGFTCVKERGRSLDLAAINVIMGRQNPGVLVFCLLTLRFLLATSIITVAKHFHHAISVIKYHEKSSAGEFPP